MPAELTLTAQSYAVLKRVPLEWWSEEDTVHEIAFATERSFPSVRAELTRLRKLGLVERRQRQTITPIAEIRRIAKA